MKIKKGDSVIVTAGKNKGKTGVIARAFPLLGKVLIDGVNVVKRHQKARRGGAKGQVIEKAMPINVSNVMIVDPKSGKPTRVTILREEGKRVRVGTKSKAVIGK